MGFGVGEDTTDCCRAERLPISEAVLLYWHMDEGKTLERAVSTLEVALPQAGTWITVSLNIIVFVPTLTRGLISTHNLRNLSEEEGKMKSDDEQIRLRQQIHLLAVLRMACASNCFCPEVLAGVHFGG